MNTKTKELTTGALFTAIFALILLLNRQTGTAFESFLIFLMPIPIVGFSSVYGLRSSIPVVIAMTLLSVIVSSPLSIFYALSQTLIGLMIGVRIHGKKDTTMTLLVTMGLSAAMNVLNTAIMALFFGYHLSDSVKEMQEMMTTAFSQANADQTTMNTLQAMLTPDYIMRILVISMIAMGLIQGFVVFELSLMILKRLKFAVPAPKNIFAYYPPFWSGILAFLCFLASYAGQVKTVSDSVKGVIQVISICGLLYLCIWGFIAVILFFKAYVTDRTIVGVLVAFMGFMVLSWLLMLFGLFYTMPVYHDRMMDAWRERSAQQQGKKR